MNVRRLLHIGSDVGVLSRMIRRLSAAGSVVRAEGESYRISLPRGEVELVGQTTARGALEYLRKEYVHGVLLDARCADRASWPNTSAAIRSVLEALDDSEDVEARYGFHRIVALVSGPGVAEVDSFLIELGRRGVQHVRRQETSADAEAFERSVLEESLALIERRRRGRRALCASGGGITGIYFELGALKCLDDCLPDGGVHGFEMYFGVSAGAVVLSLVAAGYSPAEFMAAISGHDGGRIPPVDLSLLRMGHLNVEDMKRRFAAGLRVTARQVGYALRGQVRPGVEDAFLEYTALIGPPFRSDAFGELLRGLLSARGATNDFRELDRPLFVGASDQDRRTHVLFGGTGHDHVPIHRAVQASLSIHPAFASVEIDGRWYEDGAVTRTSGFVEAVAREADLIFTLDPFVPYVSPTPGVAHRRGLLYNLDQTLRALSFTRFQNTRNWVLRRHPDVSSYTFLPSNRSRVLLSTNPMDHRPYLPIWRDAYLSTLRRLIHVEHRLRGDLAAHGKRLDLEPARKVSLRLRAIAEPRFADFFVGGRVEIPTPPLALERAG